MTMPNGPTHVLTVSELTRRIKGLLEANFHNTWVEGEVCDLRLPSSGHVYFALKDANARISVVLFRGTAETMNFKLKDGLRVVVFGDISVYDKSGQYQIVARQLVPKGLGALQFAFEEMKQRLAKEGLFDPARKKRIPVLPQCIGLVTSPTGAAIRDFLNVINRRFPNICLVISPVRVQGPGAAREIAAAIDEFNVLKEMRRLSLDVLIITRGGGSLEDLWAFNEEIVARAIARSRIPTISAVGHEIDFTIADFVADLRAPTPSAAAELVVKAKEEFAGLMRQYQKRLDNDLRRRFGELRHRFATLSRSYVFRQPAEIIRQYQQQVDDLRHRLGQCAFVRMDGRRSRLETLSGKFNLLSPQLRIAGWQQRLTAQRRHFDAAFARLRQLARHRLEHVAGKLELLSPKSTLERGYSVTRTQEGKIVKTVKTVASGMNIRTMVADGEFESVAR
jgi:exodeoxyribonuclease VII large subunit